MDKSLVCIQHEIATLQIKVCAIEALLLKDEHLRERYAKLVDEQAKVWIRERLLDGQPIV